MLYSTSNHAAPICSTLIVFFTNGFSLTAHKGCALTKPSSVPHKIAPDAVTSCSNRKNLARAHTHTPNTRRVHKNTADDSATYKDANTTSRD